MHVHFVVHNNRFGFLPANMSSIPQAYTLWVCNKESERRSESARESQTKRDRERETEKVSGRKRAGAVFSRDL